MEFIKTKISEWSLRGHFDEGKFSGFYGKSMTDSAGGIGEFDTELYKLLVRLQGML